MSVTSSYPSVCVNQPPWRWPKETVAVSIFAGPSFTFDVERLELADHVIHRREIRPPSPRSTPAVCTVTIGSIAELAATAAIALLVVFGVDSNNRIQRTVWWRGSQRSSPQ
jgi:hypothetical protein